MEFVSTGDLIEVYQDRCIIGIYESKESDGMHLVKIIDKSEISKILSPKIAPFRTNTEMLSGSEYAFLLYDFINGGDILNQLECYLNQGLENFTAYQIFQVVRGELYFGIYKWLNSNFEENPGHIEYVRNLLQKALLFIIEIYKLPSLEFAKAKFNKYMYAIEAYGACWPELVDILDVIIGKNSHSDNFFLKYEDSISIAKNISFKDDLRKQYFEAIIRDIKIEKILQEKNNLKFIYSLRFCFQNKSQENVQYFKDMFIWLIEYLSHVSVKDYNDYNYKEVEELIKELCDLSENNDEIIGLCSMHLNDLITNRYHLIIIKDKELLKNSEYFFYSLAKYTDSLMKCFDDMTIYCCDPLILIEIHNFIAKNIHFIEKESRKKLYRRIIINTRNMSIEGTENFCQKYLEYTPNEYIAVLEPIRILKSIDEKTRISALCKILEGENKIIIKIKYIQHLLKDSNPHNEKLITALLETADIGILTENKEILQSCINRLETDDCLNGMKYLTIIIKKLKPCHESIFNYDIMSKIYLIIKDNDACCSKFFDLIQKEFVILYVTALYEVIYQSVMVKENTSDIIEILKLALGKKKIEGESEISFYPEDLQIEFQVNKDIRKIVDSKLKQSNKIVLRNLANII